jgi:hypothetical protein
MECAKTKTWLQHEICFSSMPVRTLLPGNKKSNSHRTTVKWNSLSPEFHEQFVFLSSITELPKQSLHITVWDKMKGTADEYMGKSKVEALLYLTRGKPSLHFWEWNVAITKGSPLFPGGIILGLGSKSVRLQHWTDMMKTTSQFHTRIHFLSANYID